MNPSSNLALENVATLAESVDLGRLTDLIKMLDSLVRDGLLSPNGAGRGTVYFLPWQRRSTATVFDIADQAGAPPEFAAIPPELAALSPELVLTTSTVVQPLLDWSAISPALQAQLVELVQCCILFRT